MWSKYFIFGIIFTGVFSHADELICTNLKYKIVGEKLLRTTRICKNENKTTYFSENCKSGSCDIILKIKSLNKKMDIEYSPIGSPVSLACHDLDAHPYFLEVHDGTKVIKTKTCFSKKDNSFIDENLFLLMINDAQ